MCNGYWVGEALLPLSNLVGIDTLNKICFILDWEQNKTKVNKTVERYIE